MISLKTMFRQRLVRQCAVSTNSSTESNKTPSPTAIRGRPNNSDSKMYRQLSSDSLDHLLIAACSSPSKKKDDRKVGRRRHSISCGALTLDIQKPNLKSALNSAMRRMSDACFMLSSAPTSSYNLSAQGLSLAPTPSSKSEPVKKGGEVILPYAVATYRQQNLPPKPPKPPKPPTLNRKVLRSSHPNRRFSSDCPPPSYNEATNSWRRPAPRSKFLAREDAVASNSSGEQDRTKSN